MIKINTFLTFSVLLITFSFAQAQTVTDDLISKMDGTLTLESGEVTNFWGYGYDTPQEIITLPSPLLQYDVGDTVVINFKNLSPESHTIHLHGLDVDQVNDGVPQTSFFVLPNEVANYSFVAIHPGTYLYHCHVTTTLHLTMGMYGMLSINHPDQVLFDNGPGYSKLYHFLVSDLDKVVNDSPATAYPFHTMRMNYFMINGKSGEQLFEGEDNTIIANSQDSVLLRLGSMAYSKTTFIFPPLSNPVVYMSDGRPLPQPLTTDTLEIYPGERFSVLLRPQSAINDSIEVQYFSMLDKSYHASNFIGMNIEGITGTDEVSELNKTTFTIYPNPANEELFIQSDLLNQHIRLIASDGRLIDKLELDANTNKINIADLPTGIFFLMNEFGDVKKLVKL